MLLSSLKNHFEIFGKIWLLFWYLDQGTFSMFFSSGIHLLALSWLGNFFFFFLFCWVGLEIFLFWQKYIRLSLNEEQDRFGAGFQTAVNREIFIGLTVGLLLTHKDTSGFMSNTLLIPKQDLSRVYIHTDSLTSIA